MKGKAAASLVSCHVGVEAGRVWGVIRFLVQLWRFVRPYRRRLVLGAVSGVAYGLMTAVFMSAVNFVPSVVFAAPGENPLADELKKLPAWVGRALDRWVPLFEAPVPRKPMWIAISLLPLAAMLRAVLGHANVYLMNWVGIHAVTDLRTRLFSHFQHLSLDFSNRSRTGELISRIAHDCTALLTVISDSFGVIIRDPVTILSLLTWLVWKYPRLTGVSLLVFPLCAIPIVIFMRKIRKSTRTTRELNGALTQTMTEAFTSQRVVKAYNLEDKLVGEFRTTAKSIARQMMRGIQAKDGSGQVVEVFGAVAISLVFAYVAGGGEPGMNLPDFIAFFGSIVLIYPGFKALTRLHGQLEQGRAASEHVFRLLEQEATVRDPAHPMPMQARGGDIEFDRVTFGYESEPVLVDFNLRIRAGEFVALVGGSGSGKTTITSLLLRFYDPRSGVVRIGGRDLREVLQRDLRGQIAVVTQEVLLFNDTIRNNIRLGRPDATDDEVERAARHAHAHGFIHSRPEGYDTMVGDKGALLSGGQKQRLAIARALLKDAPVLVLDEATSALDTESERAVQVALEALMKGRTTLCIAHRLSTVQNADRIIVMEQGRIVEEGRHAELVARGGYYARLHAMQNG